MGEKIRISRKVFEKLMAHLWSAYDAYLKNLVEEKRNHSAIKAIRSNTGGLLNPDRGLSKYIFGKAAKSERYFSIGSFIEKNTKDIPKIDLGDFLYKKCSLYKKGNIEFEIFNAFFEISGYQSLEDFCEKENINNDPSIFSAIEHPKQDPDQKLTEHLKGLWRMYYYNYEDYLKKSGIVGAIFRVEDINQMYILNSPLPGGIDYSGGKDYNEPEIEGILYLQFNPLNKKEIRPLKIALHISPDVNFDMAIGQYNSIDASKHLMRGSLIMEKLHDNADEKEQPILYYDEDETESIARSKNKENPNLKELNPDIKYFLKNRDLNFNRLPNNKFRRDRFHSWIEKREFKKSYEKEYEKKKKKELGNENLYISCPINTLPPGQFNQMKKTVVFIENFFTKEKGFQSAYSYISSLQEQYAKDYTPSFFEYRRARKKYEDCTLHIVIWPRNTGVSGMLFEIGWSNIMDKPTVIFEEIPKDKKDDNRMTGGIPQLILGACESKNTNMVKIPYIDYNDLKEKIKTVGADIFKIHS